MGYAHTVRPGFKPLFEDLFNGRYMTAGEFKRYKASLGRQTFRRYNSMMPYGST